MTTKRSSLASAPATIPPRPYTENLNRPVGEGDPESVHEKLDQAKLYWKWMRERRDQLKVELTALKKKLALAPGHALYVRDFADVTRQHREAVRVCADLKSQVSQLQRKVRLGV